MAVSKQESQSFLSLLQHDLLKSQLILTQEEMSCREPNHFTVCIYNDELGLQCLPPCSSLFSTSADYLKHPITEDEQTLPHNARVMTFLTIKSYYAIIGVLNSNLINYVNCHITQGFCDWQCLCWQLCLRSYMQRCSICSVVVWCVFVSLLLLLRLMVPVEIIYCYVTSKAKLRKHRL